MSSTIGPCRLTRAAKAASPAASRRAVNRSMSWRSDSPATEPPSKSDSICRTTADAVTDDMATPVLCGQVPLHVRPVPRRWSSIIPYCQKPSEFLPRRAGNGRGGIRTSIVAGGFVEPGFREPTSSPRLVPVVTRASRSGYRLLERASALDTIRPAARRGGRLRHCQFVHGAVALRFTRSPRINVSPGRTVNSGLLLASWVLRGVRR